MHVFVRVLHIQLLFWPAGIQNIQCPRLCLILGRYKLAVGLVYWWYKTLSPRAGEDGRADLNLVEYAAKLQQHQ